MLGTMEQRTVGMKKQAQELIDQAYQRGYNAGYEEGKGQTWSEEVKKYEIEPEKSLKYIEQGRNEAWEAAKKLVQMDYVDCTKVLDCVILTDEEIFVRCTASEAIKKLRAYEEKQEEDGIKVGDEVEFVGTDIKGIVISNKTTHLRILVDDYITQLHVGDLIPTGRHFPEIAEVLKKMKENK